MAVAKSDPKNGTIIFTGGTGSQGGLNGGFRVRRRHAGPGSLMAANDAKRPKSQPPASPRFTRCRGRLSPQMGLKTAAHFTAGEAASSRYG